MSTLEKALTEYGDWRLLRWGEWLCGGFSPSWVQQEETPQGTGCVIPDYEAMEVEVVLMRAPRYQDIARVHYYLRPRMRWDTATCFAMVGCGQRQYYYLREEACLLVAVKVGPPEMRGCLA